MRTLLLCVFLSAGCGISYVVDAVPIGPPQRARAADAPVSISPLRYQDAIVSHDEVGRACFAQFGGFMTPSIGGTVLRGEVAREARSLGADVALVLDRCQIGRTPGLSISFMKTRS